jgi:hypothetical protein
LLYAISSTPIAHSGGSVERRRASGAAWRGSVQVRRREERRPRCRILPTLSVGDIFVVDEDFRHGELWDRGHAALFLLVLGAPEATGPVECVEETYDDVAADGFFDALEACAAAEELFKSVEYVSGVSHRYVMNWTYLKLLLSLMTLWWAKIIRSDENWMPLSGSLDTSTSS